MPQSSLKRFFISVVLPSILAIGLFILSIFLVILPSFERNALEGKKETISELTRSVISLLEEYHQESELELMPADSARELALERIKRIRYGDEQKDYFWIIDLEPRMLMHPYRPELIGQSLVNYRDPEGKKLFVESVRLIETDGEGFIDYRWQWKDDSTRIVPKLSYVKSFPEWNWIVGTGIYLEDVHVEIAGLKRELLRVALLITVVISIILAFIIRNSLRIERSRRVAEQDLRISREKYKSLVEASSEGTLMLVGGHFSFSNLKFSKLCSFDPEEVLQKKFEDLFSFTWESLEALISDPKKSVSREGILHCKDGNSKDVVLSVSRISYSGQTAHIIQVKEVSARSHFEQESLILNAELQSALAFMNQSLHAYGRKVVLCRSDLNLIDAAQLMAKKESDILFVQQEEKIIGSISSNDLSTRVLSKGEDPHRKVIEFMNAPVRTLPEKALLSEALLLMKTGETSAIALTDDQGRIRSFFGLRELLQMQENLPAFMVKEIQTAEDVNYIKRIYNRLPVLIEALIESGSRSRNLSGIIARVADAIHVRLIELALEELGPAPCDFAFMVLGSQARSEQTLATDQDNAIIFGGGSKGQKESNRLWFLKLGKQLNRDLDQVGYRYCPGDIMAGNPKWSQDLDTWKKYFRDWVFNSDPQSVLYSSIFFDMHCIYGKESLVEDLRAHVHQLCAEQEVFFLHMAQSIIKIKAPSVRQDEDLDVKMATLPMTSFLRLYAIRNFIQNNNSLERARILHEKEKISKEVLQELSQALEIFTRYRLQNQSRAISRNEPGGNLLNTADISNLDITVLKNLLKIIHHLQTKLGTDYNI